MWLLLSCDAWQQPIGRCRTAPNQQPFTTQLPLMEDMLDGTYPALTESFHWGTATAAYQIESNITQSDWSLWERIANGDSALNGPAHELHYAADISSMLSLGTNSYRFGIEWSRVFPTREAMLTGTPDAEALAYYQRLLDALVAAGIRPMVTLQHFTLPVWLEGGLLAPDFVALMTRWAAFCAEQFGDRVDYWITINEPSGVAGGGYLEGTFPPGHFVDLAGFKAAYGNMVEAHARMYDALAAGDREDADGDGLASSISFASHNRLFIPRSDADIEAARRLRWISNLVLIEAASCGNYDANFDEVLDPAVDRVADPTLRDRLDYLAVNYYGTAEVVALPIEPYRGAPLLVTSSARAKTDLGWDIAPEGLLPVLQELVGYRMPIYITENGVADAADVLRPRFLVDSLTAVQAARASGFDIRGYYHWSLIDNFEWAYGFCPRLGLVAVDHASKARTERPSAAVYREIIAARGVPASLRHRYVYGTPTLCPGPER